VDALSIHLKIRFIPIFPASFVPFSITPGEPSGPLYSEPRLRIQERVVCQELEDVGGMEDVGLGREKW